MDGFRQMTLFVAERASEQEFRHTKDSVHRRPNFVAHVCEELTLGPAGRFGGLPWPDARTSSAVLRSVTSI